MEPVYLQVLIGSMMIVITIVIKSWFIAVAMIQLNNKAAFLNKMGFMMRTMFTLSVLSLWLMAGIGVALYLWSILFVVLGEFETLTAALYFSSVAATTVGFGDVLLSDQWQLLAGFIAANGLVLFSLTTGFLFEVFRRLHQATLAENLMKG